MGALLAGSYVLGSLPFGLWLVKKWKGIDIRTYGSGNIGSTNVGRIAGRKGWAIVFTLDVLKGLLPPLAGVALHLASPWQILAALCAILGHNYSFLLDFKGGKGIATSLGALLGIAPKVGLMALGIFGVEMLLLGYVSLGSLLAALSLPLLMPIFYPHDNARLAFGLLACVMAFYKHRANIQRLRAGTEPKMRLGGTQAEKTEQAEEQSASPGTAPPSGKKEQA